MTAMYDTVTGQIDQRRAVCSRAAGFASAGGSQAARIALACTVHDRTGSPV
jgi:hypothetical protein